MQNRVWLRETLALLLVLVAMSPVFAQGQPFPTLKGSNARTGNNGSPSTSNPGAANLNWFAPSFALGDNRGLQTTVDNADPTNVAFSANWIVPAAGNEAAGAYWPVSTAAPYRYAVCVPSDLTDNTLSLSGGLETATFTLSPSDATARDYAVYVHLPDGPTIVGTGTLYQAAYEVVKVTPSSGASFVDVIHVDAVGKGWVRIGNGGLSTAKLFHYDGSNPITVTLYNTIPRDSSGNLLDTRTPSSIADYADAARLSPDLGSYTASPTVAQISSTDGRVVGAVNTVGLSATGDTLTQSVVYSRNYKTGQVMWQWSPTSAATGGNGAIGVTMDNQDAGVTAPFPFVSDTSGTPGSYLGSDYFSATITNDNTAAEAVQYRPTLDDGNYNIYLHTVQGGTFGKNVQIEISEDGGATFTQVTVDETQTAPWVKIGTRRYNSKASSLWVFIENYSADTSDAGKLAYADAVKFEGEATGAITSTPVQAKVFLRTSTNSVPVLTNVVLVATEQGVIYCLDAIGNGDKTTNVYWTYPSANSTSDPNQVSGKDGVGPLSTNPTQFNMSSALVQSTRPADWVASASYHSEDWVTRGGNFYISVAEPNVGTDPAADAGHTHWVQVSDPSDATHAQDRLFIGGSNGRVYSIDMTGRGDYTSTSPGTTARVWTYPDDYPSTVQASSLGAFKCSLAYANATDNASAVHGTIYACTAEGRIFALDATGDPILRTTTTFWKYPLDTDTPTGAFTSTPAVAFGNLYVGTAMRDNGSQPGQFFCIKANSTVGSTNDWGTVVWSFSSDADASADNFFGGPAVAAAADLNGPFASSMPDTVFASNQNRYVYAFNAHTGAVQWKTLELNAGVQGPLTFTYLTVPFYDTVAGTFNSTATPVPVVMVPTENGHVVGLYANTQIVNRVNNGTRRAWEYDMSDGTVSGIACGFNYMYSVDQSGYMYAFNAVGGSFGSETPPGSPVITENDPRYDRYATAKIKLIKASGYRALRNGTATYGDINGGTYDLGTPGYEYGETLYAIVYNYPYDVVDKDGNGISPPIANFNLSVEGATLTSVSSNSQQISGAPAGSPSVGHLLDGYSLLTFQVDLAGTFSLPPGSGIVQATLTSAYNGASQPYALSNVDGQGEKAFNIANPIGISIPASTEEIGYSPDGSIAENKVNGNPTTKERITASTGAVNHGQSGISDVQVYDRSLMTLKRGAGFGLGFVRVQRGDLTWRWPSGGSATSPITTALPSWAPNFEDYPTNQPNTSRDYPDIRHERVSVTKNPTGSPENPIFNGVELTPPTNVDESAPLTRVLQPTPFRFNLDVPKYQPANTSGFTNSLGTAVPGGYAGQMVVFVDSTQTGTFDITSPKRSAYRTLYFASAVSPDAKLKLGQSVIDLKSLSGGAGFGATPPWSGGAPAPWPTTAPTSGMYQNMDVYNMGNVNLLHVRLSHGRTDGTTVTSTPFNSATVDPYAFLDSQVHLYSDLDPIFWDAEVASKIGGGAPGAYGPFAVKPRVGDRQPAKMSVNPRSRINGNALIGDLNWPAGASPKVTMVIPLGFPAGSYSHTIRVIEDNVNPNGLLDVSGGTPVESYSDPTAILKFKVAETQLTNGFSLYNIPMIDPALPAAAPNAFKNKQPTGMRTPSGNLVVAWISDRANPGDASYSTSTPAYAPSPAYPSAAVLNPQDRLYIAGVQGDASTMAVNGVPSGLGDLSNFTPQTGSTPNWFAYRNPSDPFPKDDAEALNLLGTYGASSVTGVRMHHPSLPTLGAVSPTDSTVTFSKVWLAVVGDGQVQATAGVQNVSRIVLAPVTISGAAPVLDSSNAGYIDAEDSSAKGKPSIVQLTDTSAVVFFASGGGGQSQLSYAKVDMSAFVGGTRKFASQIQSIDLPHGFELSGAPSAVLRFGTVGTASKAYFELSFIGKLAGRPNTEAFLARIPFDGANLGGLALFPSQGEYDSVINDNLPYESLINEGGGVFRARGVGWDLNSPIALADFNHHVSLIDTSKRPVVDSDSGIVTYNSSVLGGKVYLDTKVGTVRFSASVPLSGMDVRLSYTPSVVRLNEPSAAGHAGVSLIYDNHQVDYTGYWKDASSDTALDPTATLQPAKANRYVVTYNRASTGGGQAARPYWKTMRQGIQLSHSLFVASNGAVDVHVTPSLPSGLYQYDPVKGRLYFTDNTGGIAMETWPKAITVTYTGLDQTTGAAIALSEVHTIGLINELDESAVPIDVPVNENGLTTFFDPKESTDAWRRPTLLWMIWSSARGNGSDLFMQTVAPRLIPAAGN